MNLSKASDAPPLLTIAIARPHQQQQQPLSSTCKTFANVFISIVGAGVLGLPFTFRRSGWLLSSLALLSIAIFSFYCMMLLVSTRRRHRRDQLASFSDLGSLAFGPAGRHAVDAMLVLSQGAFCVAYLIFIGENLASIFGNDGRAVLPAIADGDAASAIANDHSLPFLRALQAVPERLGGFLPGGWSSKDAYIWIVFPVQIALASIRSLTSLAPFSIVADFANLVAMAVVMQQDVARFAGRGIASVQASQGISSLPFAIGVAIYAFEGIGLVLPLEASMREKRKFGTVLAMAMASITALYMLFGLLGYLAFGEETLDIVTLNLGKNGVTMAVKLGLCVGLFFTFPVMMHPVHEIVERRVSFLTIPPLILRTVIVLLAVWCAVTVPRFGDFLSLIGSSVCCILAFVLPALIHLKLHSGELSRLVAGVDYFLVAFGLAFGVWGTVSALKGIIGAS